MKEEYKSRVYTDRPAYADLPAPDKFQAIMGIIATRLKQHPNAICSYSGGSDSDIMLDLIERTREAFNLPPIKYAFFNTGLEMAATRNKAVADLEKIKPYEPNVVKAAWNIFGDSYRYRMQYNEYKKKRMEAEKSGGQMSFDDMR